MRLGSRRQISRRLCVIAFIAIANCNAAEAEGLGRISDFMTMDVCVDASGRQTLAIPGSRDCEKHRDVMPGELPSYKLQNFPPRDGRCSAGLIGKLNVPVTKGANTRIISSTMRQKDCDGLDQEPDIDRSGASIQWYDQAFGFIMGSYSPVSLSSFESDRCLRDAASSQRFFRGWVIGPADVPALGASGFGTFPSKLKQGSASNAMGGCAGRYNRALTTWVATDFKYKSGRQFASLVSSHYSRGSASGKNPGDAMQVEGTYWTREFGLSRWEKWAREDWVHPRSKKTSLALARALFASGRCSPLTMNSVNFNAEMQVTDEEDSLDVYSKTIRNPLTGEAHLWYMTLCEDYTNVVASSNVVNSLETISRAADNGYWK